MTLEHVKSMPNKIKNFQKELDALYDYLVGANIKSTVDFSNLKFNDEYTWTYIYKHDPEERTFKVNHAGEHFYMTEEDMWEILENAIEIEK